MIFAFTTAATASAVPPAAASAATGAGDAATTLVAVPQQINAEQAQAIADALDPSRVAQYLPAPPPSSPGVEIADIVFDGLGNATLALVLVVLIIFVGRLLQAFLLHRSINKAIAAKSDVANGLIEKVNMPMDLTLPGRARDGDAVDAGVGDVRGALVLIAIGVAMAGFGLIQGAGAPDGGDMIRLALGAALFPLLVGGALLLRRRIVQRERAEDRAAALG